MTKKVPRAIKKELIDQLKEINKDINMAIETLLHANSRKSGNLLTEEKTELDNLRKSHAETKEFNYEDLSNNIWPYLNKKIESMIDLAIEDAKRGY